MSAADDEAGRFVIRTVYVVLELGWTEDGVTVTLNLLALADWAADATSKIVSPRPNRSAGARRIMNRCGR